MNHTDPYFDIYRPEGENQVFCYRSGLAVYEETFTKGILVSSGWNAAGYPLNVLAGYPTRIDHKLFDEPSAFHVEIDGQSIDYDLEFVDFSTNRQEDRLETVLTLRSRIQPNPEQLAFVQRSVGIYKNFIRKFLPGCKVFHHTPESDLCQKNATVALEIAAPDGSRGAATVFALTCAKQEPIRFFPRGLDASKTYRVTLDNSGAVATVSGYALQNDGILLRIPASLSSELLLFEATE